MHLIQRSATNRSCCCYQHGEKIILDCDCATNLGYQFKKNKKKKNVKP